jgi:membrane-associated phospholipid phosphatase
MGRPFNGLRSRELPADTPCHNATIWGMKQFFLTLPRNIIGCFRGRRIIWHAAAIALTFFLVMSGFDWRYFLATVLRSWVFPAVPMGGLLPIVLPLLLLAIGLLARSGRIRLTGWAVGQAELIGALVAASYKALTGRIHPPHGAGGDLSHIFRFGILRGGVFWGWPSSHTTVAFAMAFAIFTLWPKQRWLGYAAIIYSFYVGIGVSMTIHWFSDFVAGAMFGTVVGMVVGKSFLLSRAESKNPPSQEHTAQLPRA